MDWHCCSQSSRWPVAIARPNIIRARRRPARLPKDWKFALPRATLPGRKLFVEIECYKCHEVKGESFPNVAANEKGVGPELSQMGGMHPVEFFAESIANPNAVIDEDAKEQGHVGPDGRSKMPSFADILTVKQLADLATYLASLGGEHKR